MGCAQSSVYPLPERQSEDPEGDGYDPRWDRYRFRSNSSQGSDGSSAEENSVAWLRWQVRLARLKACIAPCFVNYQPRRYTYQELDLCPRPMTLDDSDDEKPTQTKDKDGKEKKKKRIRAGVHLDKVERAKLKKWLETIAESEVEGQLKSLSDYGRDGHDPALSASRSRGSIHTTYTQDEADLIRTASHCEPVRLTDQQTIQRLQQHLDRQRVRNKMMKRQEQQQGPGPQAVPSAAAAQGDQSQRSPNGGRSGIVRPAQEEACGYYIGGVPTIQSRDSSPANSEASPASLTSPRRQTSARHLPRRSPNGTHRNSPVFDSERE